MLKMSARRCLVIIKYNDKDISADLQQYLKNVSYTDNMSGEADDLQLTLEDKAGLWQASWMPEKGATLDVSVKLINWQSIGEQVVRFGLFEIDEITSSGMPSEVQIKAVSVPDNNNLRGAERTRSWEKAELKRIANDIATEAGLTLYYDVKEYNPVIDRAEQTEQSDLSFLYKLCADHGLALKICDKQVVIFDEADYEAATPAAQGTEVLVYNKWSPADTLAGCILRQITGSLGTVDRGVKARPGLIVLNSTHMPAVLVEMGFISNGNDCEMLIKQQDELARAIARGITDYIQERGV